LPKHKSVKTIITKALPGKRREYLMFTITLILLIKPKHFFLKLLLSPAETNGFKFILNDISRVTTPKLTTHGPSTYD